MKNGSSFLPLVRLTCVEIPRQPAVLLLTTTLIVFMGALPFLITHNLGEPGKLVRDSSLAMMFLGSLLLAVPAACNAVSTEIRRGTAGAILSKPISRVRFLAAKYLGVSSIMLVFSVMATLTILISDRAAARAFHPGWNFIIPLFVGIVASYVVAAGINFKTGRPFASTAFWCLALALILVFIWTLVFPGGESVQVQQGDHTHAVAHAARVVPVRWDIIPACVALTCAACMIQALALLCALRLGMVPTLSTCTGFFLLGLMSDYLLARRAVEMFWARALYVLMPNWQHFWLADALTAGGSIPWSYVLNAAGYALFWTVGILFIAMGMFDRMEVR